VSESLEAFRTRVRAWMASQFAPIDRARDDDRTDIIVRTPNGHQAFVDGSRALQKQLYDAGFVGLKYPKEYGGGGLTARHDEIVDEELLHVASPSRRGLGIGIHLALPTILKFGTEEQKRRFIAPMLQGEELWCQLFSEPDAGSDLVSLRAKGVLDGDQWMVSGQKVWSSYAADANFGLLLARTDPDSPKPHTGISMFILPMDRRGVAVRPLVDIAGGHHFNEVFLEDVALEPSLIVGELHRGWDVANGTLGGERKGYMGGSGDGRRHRQVIDVATRFGYLNDRMMRQRIVRVIAEERMLEMLRDRLEVGQVAGGHPAAGSMMKVAAGNLEQRVAELLVDMSGPSGIAWDATDRDADIPSHAVNASRQATIAGGTHQIQRNLLGERVLGLPR
jgi:alkylation response protein AidB-like acyl-CoA dehydrogenase